MTLNWNFSFGFKMNICMIVYVANWMRIRLIFSSLCNVFLKPFWCCLSTVVFARYEEEYMYTSSFTSAVFVYIYRTSNVPLHPPTPSNTLLSASFCTILHCLINTQQTYSKALALFCFLRLSARSHASAEQAKLLQNKKIVFSSSLKIIIWGVFFFFLIIEQNTSYT